MFRLTKIERAVLETLWDADGPLYRSQIVKASPDRTWKENSLPAALNTLAEKGAIKVAGIVKAGKGFARAYVPAMTREEYALKQFSANLPDASEKSKIEGVFAALINTDSIDQETLDSLKRIIEQKEEEIK